MKNSVILLFSIIIFSVTFVTNAGSACLQGWSSGDFTGSWGDCDYTVYYCYQVNPNGILIITIDQINFPSGCQLNDFLNDEDFWNQIYEELNDDVMSEGSFPPCPHSAYNVVVSRVHCWKIHNDPSHSRFELIDCGLSKRCEYLYKICYNQSLGRNTIELVSTKTVSGESCDDEMPDLTDPVQYPPSFEWTTYCFFTVGCV